MSHQRSPSNQADLNEIDFAIDSATTANQPASAAQTETDSGNDSRVNFLAKLLGAGFETSNEQGGDSTQPNHQQTAVENEWTDIPVIEAKFVEPSQAEAEAANQPAASPASVQPVQPSSVLLHFKVAWDQLTNGVSSSELSDHDTSSTTPDVQSGGCYEFLKCLIDQSDLDPRLSVSRNLIIKLTQTPFDNGNQVHLRILQTIYKKLTASSIDCPRYGSHWELIGFQGNDPATDLRGCGMLSLILLIYILDSDYLEASLDIYHLSKHETQNFPFCVVGINLVSLLVKLLNKGTLNKHLNKIHSLHRHSKHHKSNLPNNLDQTLRFDFASICGKFFMALFLEFYLEWKTNVKTISDFGFVLNDLELKATGSAKFLFKQLDVHLFNQKFKKGTKSQPKLPNSFQPNSGGLGVHDQVLFSALDD